ncbi:hypothetical protein CJU90_3767 [Yarrowia sp. C11]|nr:hypothetical protein CKK34_5377 [Yarrowia sp. E02]KAG5367470.1 hypothetical protein CJU90_3767 [Yarrowia sp. C11]
MYSSETVLETSKKLALDALCMCRLPGVGTFFLVTSTGLHLLRESGSLESYEQYTDFFVGNLFVVDEFNVGLMGEAYDRGVSETLLITSYDDWSTVQTDPVGLSMHRLATLFTNYMAGNGSLSRFRQGHDHDFKLVCKEGTDIPVHRLVMNRKWPYFRKKIDSEHKTILHLDVAESVLESVVAHLYEQHKPLMFEDAVALITVAHRYDLPALLLEAMRRIRIRGVGFEEAVLIWKQCYMTGNKPLRLYCSDAIFRATSRNTVDSPPELLKELTQEQYSQLFLDFNEIMK